MLSLEDEVVEQLCWNWWVLWRKWLAPEKGKHHEIQWYELLENHSRHWIFCNEIRIPSKQWTIVLKKHSVFATLHLFWSQLAWPWLFQQTSQLHPQLLQLSYIILMRIPPSLNLAYLGAILNLVTWLLASIFHHLCHSSSMQWPNDGQHICWRLQIYYKDH